MNEPNKFSSRPDDLYPITWFRKPYFLLIAMLCRLYGLSNCSVYKAEWASVAHHVLTTGESFPWSSILSLELKTTIRNYQKATTWKKPNFFFSSFIIDVFCIEFQYPHLGWNWTLQTPPVPIYYSTLWDNNYMPSFYDICEYFMGTIYFKIFKVQDPSFSPKARALISTMGN